jgi:hypothetical protein
MCMYMHNVVHVHAHFTSLTRYNYVILKIRPLSNYNNGHHMSIRRNSDILSKKLGYFGGSSMHPGCTQGCFLRPFFRRLQICITVTEKSVTLTANLVGCPVS